MGDHLMKTRAEKEMSESPRPTKRETSKLKGEERRRRGWRGGQDKGGKRFRYTKEISRKRVKQTRRKTAMQLRSKRGHNSRAMRGEKPLEKTI